MIVGAAIWWLRYNQIISIAYSIEGPRGGLQHGNFTTRDNIYLSENNLIGIELMQIPLWVPCSTKNCSTKLNYHEHQPFYSFRFRTLPWPSSPVQIASSLPACLPVLVNLISVIITTHENHLHPKTRFKVHFHGAFCDAPSSAHSSDYTVHLLHLKCPTTAFIP